MKKQAFHTDGRVFSIEERGKTNIHVLVDGKQSPYVIKQWGATDRWYVVQRTPLGDEMPLHYSVSNGQTVFGRTMTFKTTDGALAAVARDCSAREGG